MKNLLFTSLVLLMLSSASAEESEYVPLVREGVVWEYVSYLDVLGESYSNERLYSLEFNGENEHGHMLYRTDYSENGNAQDTYLVAYAKEENKVVTAQAVNYWWEIPDTSYMFNKQTFLPDDVTTIEQVEPIIVYVDGHPRNGYYFFGYYSPEYEFKIIEGIGIDCMFGDLLLPYRFYYTSLNPMAGLSAVYENGELVYKGCLYDIAQQLKMKTSINTASSSKQISSVHYYNLAGVESHEPQQGVNIRVTTYTDGSRHSEKIVR